MDLSNVNSPDDFFEKFLPGVINEGLAGSGRSDTLNDTTDFNVLGEGTWSSQVVDGLMRVKDEPSESPMLQITTTSEDFGALFLSAHAKKLMGGAADKKDQGLLALNKVIFDDLKRERLKAMSGDLQIALTTDAGTTHRITFTLGGKPYDHENPTCTISVKMADWLDIMDGKANPQEAFFQGKIRLEGDMNLAMGFTALMM